MRTIRQWYAHKWPVIERYGMNHQFRSPLTVATHMIIFNGNISLNIIIIIFCIYYIIILFIIISTYSTRVSHEHDCQYFQHFYSEGLLFIECNFQRRIFYGVFQAQQLFRKDSKIITPEALATVKSAIANSGNDKKVEFAKNSFKKK